MSRAVTIQPCMQPDTLAFDRWGVYSANPLILMRNASVPRLQCAQRLAWGITCSGGKKANNLMSADVTTLLEAIRGGEPAAANQLFNLLYSELKQLAQRQLSRQSQDRPASLDTTALVHESYLKLIDGGALKPEDRSHFFAYTASVMRSVIVDFARNQLAEKRGGQYLQVTLNTGVADTTPVDNAQLLQIHEAIDELTAIDARMGKLVELRYFAGLNEQEAADTLGISKRTAQREWEKSRLFLHASLQEQ